MSNGQNAAPTGRLNCFVVMGFGLKTDYATGRKLDLDKSYRLLIMPVVEAAGLNCVRADEIRYSGSIDLQMYQQLLTADVVIADLSTANPNALYELGIRHGLKPRATIVISENGLPYPFDLNHIVITSYTHLGDALDYDEVIRFQKVLGQQLQAVLRARDPDSPVYTFLSLSPPTIIVTNAGVAQSTGPSSQPMSGLATQVTFPPSQQRLGLATRDTGQPSEPMSGLAIQIMAVDPPVPESLAELIERGELAIKESRFADAKAIFSQALELGVRAYDGDQRLRRDPYLVQRLVLATYKAKKPDELSGLREALDVLAELNPDESNDPETVGLAGAIEKRLFDQRQGPEHLHRAIRYYARGYYLRDDYYNGINLAFLLTLRTTTPLDQLDEERIADLVESKRIRKEVLALCERELQEITARDKEASKAPEEFRQDQIARDREQKFWCLATKAEAHFGLGDFPNFAATKAQLQGLSSADWMMQTFNGQIEKLGQLLTVHGHLLQAGWHPPPVQPSNHATTGAANASPDNPD